MKNTLEQSSRSEKPTSLKHRLGRLAAKTMLVLSGASVALTGIAAGEAATGYEGRAEAGISKEKYDAFMKQANSAEKSWCTPPSRWKLCMDVLGTIANEATASAQYTQAKQGWGEASLHNGKGDAFRHCFFMAKITRVHDVFTAKGFGDRHEAGPPPGMPALDPAEIKMDQQNNLEGRHIGVTNGSIYNRCVAAANSGQLVTL